MSAPDLQQRPVGQAKPSVLLTPVRETTALTVLVVSQRGRSRVR